jgi:N-acylglucosamine 2-epimerase
MWKRLQEQYEENLFGSVLPFWLRHSLDREHGGYFTCLDTQGAVYDTRKYIWLNGRQVWTLSRLYNQVERRPEWLEVARLGAEFLRAHAFDEKGRCYFSLTREGQPSFYQRKPYAGLFVMLGFSEYAKATGDEWYQAKAEELFVRVQDWIADARLLDRPALAGGVAYSNLADIYAICSMAQQLDRPDALRACIQKIPTHYVPERRLLLETAALDPAQRFTYPDGRLICTGSNFEIAWILFRALDQCPDPAVEKMLLDCIEGALEFGWDSEHGGLYYFQDIDGRPMLQLESDMKLWWVHVEALLALIHAYSRTRDGKWLRWLERVQEWTWAHFPDPNHGEWFGYLHRDGSVSHQLKGNHYKGCFHIPRMLLFGSQEIARIREQESRLEPPAPR